MVSWYGTRGVFTNRLRTCQLTYRPISTTGYRVIGLTVRVAGLYQSRVHLTQLHCSSVLTVSPGDLRRGSRCAPGTVGTGRQGLKVWIGEVVTDKMVTVQVAS